MSLKELNVNATEFQPNVVGGGKRKAVMYIEKDEKKRPKLLESPTWKFRMNTI